MTFLAPWLLVGLLAAGIPLVIHLRRARQSRTLLFSTTRFFDRQFLRASRRARLQDRLVMLLRMALLALLALALAQPLVRIPGLLLGPAGPRHVAIVLDDSVTMGIVSDRGQLLERAKAGALAVVDGLSLARGDRATVLLAGRREDGASVLFEKPTTDLEAVRRAIRGTSVSDLGTDLEAAIRRAGAVLGADTAARGTRSGPRDVYVFSDLQETAFNPGAAVSPGPGTALFLVHTAAPRVIARENVSVDAVQFAAARPMLGVPFTFRALVTNHGREPQRPDIALVIGDEVVSHKTATVPPGRSVLVRFVHRFLDPGWHWGRVEATNLTADAVAADNRRHFALQVRGSLRIAAVNGSPSRVPARDELFFLRAALSIGSAPQETPSSARGGGPSTGGPSTGGASMVLDELGPADLDPRRLENASLAVLANVADLPPAGLEALEHFVDAGGNLLVTLGDRVEMGAYESWVGDGRLHGGLLPGRLRSRVGAGEGWDQDAGPDALPGVQDDGAGFIGSVDPAHPVTSGFVDGTLGSLASVRFGARYVVDAQGAGFRGGGVLARANNGDAVLLEKPFGKGKVVLLTTSLDRDWTNFPLQPAFVPFLYRLLGYLAHPGLERANFVRTGQVVRIPSSVTRAQPMQITLPEGRVDYPEPDPGGQTADSVFRATDRAGIYRVAPGAAVAGSSADPKPDAVFAANIPSDESVPKSLDENGLRDAIDADTAWRFISDPESVSTSGDIARRGIGLWDQLLILALIIGIVEPWLANRLSRGRLAAGGQTPQRNPVRTETDPSTRSAA